MKASGAVYRCSVDPQTDSAATHILRFVGRNKKVLDLGAGTVVRQEFESREASSTRRSVSSRSTRLAIRWRQVTAFQRGAQPVDLARQREGVRPHFLGLGPRPAQGFV